MAQTLYLDPLEKALASLTAAVERAQREKEDDMLRDSVIKRFEYSFELCWKALRRRLQMDAPSPQTIAAMSFREMIREGAARALLDDPVAWFSYREKRNLTSHTYDEAVAKDVYLAALSFLGDAMKLLRVLKAKNDA